MQVRLYGRVDEFPNFAGVCGRNASVRDLWAHVKRFMPLRAV